MSEGIAGQWESPGREPDWGAVADSPPFAPLGRLAARRDCGQERIWTAADAEHWLLFGMQYDCGASASHRKI
jgi:hypothetical protein